MTKVANTAKTSLADRMKHGAEQAKKEAEKAIEGLAVAAGDLEMRETADKLRMTARQLRSDTFNIIVMGRFNNGKSTLLNALLGGTTKPVDLKGHKGPMVVDDLPATAILTAVRYADDPFVRLWTFDNAHEQWTFDRYLSESTLGIDEDENEKRFAHIREFEMGFPARLCQAGVTVYDSPGLNDKPQRTAVTRAAIEKCDAAIVVYRTDALMSHNELMDAAQVVQEGTRVFTVINLYAGRKVDDRLKAYVWNRYVHEQLGGPKWAGQHDQFLAHDIFFVDAEMARTARYTGDEALAEASGLTLLEQRLGEFLLRDRHRDHLKKFVTQANNLTATIDQHITQRRMAIDADQERLREAHTAILPKLAAIHARPQKLPALFRRYRVRAETELQAAFTELVARIRQELPDHVEALELRPSPITGVFQQDKLLKEISAAISAFVSEKVQNWGRQEVATVLRPILEELGEEVEHEIAAIGRQFDEIHLNLTGWEVRGEGGAVVGTTERVLSAVASVLMGNALGAVGAGAGGWRGALGSMAGAVGAALVLGVLGVTSAAIFWPVALAAALLGGLLGGGMSLVKRAKKKALEHCDEELRKLPEELSPKLMAELGEKFEQLEKVVTEEISGLIEEEERNVREIIELNQRDQAEKASAMARLNEAATALGTHRLALQRALTAAGQVS